MQTFRPIDAKSFDLEQHFPREYFYVSLIDEHAFWWSWVIIDKFGCLCDAVAADQSELLYHIYIMISLKRLCSVRVNSQHKLNDISG